MNIFHKTVSPLLVSVLFLSGCAVPGAPMPQQVEDHVQQLEALTKSRTVTVLDESYLGAKLVIRHEDMPVALSTKVTLRRKGTLPEIVESMASMMLPLSVQLAPEETDSKGEASKAQADQGAPDDLFALLDVPSSTGKILSISYEGTLHGLLELIAAQAGCGWEYDVKTNSILFAKMQVRTFTIMAAPGTVSHSNQITNKSKDSSGSLGGSPGVNQTVSASDTQSQTAQTNTTSWKFDIWDECLGGVKALLSAKGVVVGNQAAGTISVRDTPDRLRQISTYIADINTRLERQVALTVRVWSLELSDDSEAGFDLQVLFENKNLSVVAGSLSSLGGASSAMATIVNGKLKNSSAALKAMRQWGNVTQVTSAGGVLMSNQPLPSQAIQRHAYLAGMSSSQSDNGTETSSLTPGEVTTGFAMTLIPHILDRRRVILQYNINLSSLDEMVELTAKDTKIQLPQVSTRSFSQRTTMKMGQTLVLAGFQQESQSASNGLGFLSGSRGRAYGKSLLIITIEVESAEV